VIESITACEELVSVRLFGASLGRWRVLADDRAIEQPRISPGMRHARSGGMISNESRRKADT